MKNFIRISLISLLFPLLYNEAFSQSAAWMWEGGDSLLNQPAFYGAKNIPAPENTPGARKDMMTWTTNDGLLWLFGGEDNNYPTGAGYLNDLWTFNPQTKQWTWMNGDNIPNQKGIYGNKGSFSFSSNPGARKEAVTWVGNDSCLWLFGGSGYSENSSGLLNDLWKYSPKLNQWVWINGEKNPNMPGKKGKVSIPDSASYPGARDQASGSVDKNGDFWLHGGNGYDFKGEKNYLSDLWRFDVSSGLWSWESGAIEGDHSGKYGIKGIPSPENLPGSRYGFATWQDDNNNLYIFGGTGRAASSLGSLNDLWKFDLNNKAWTWMSGDSTPNSAGNYGIKGTGALENNPGSRIYTSFWKDNSGCFFLFGGTGYSKSGTGYLNDLWKYDPVTGFWTWLHGNDISNKYGKYGTMGLPDTSNCPGSRMSATVWKDVNNKIWLFGGYGYEYSGPVDNLKDLWSYIPSTNQWIWEAGDNNNYNISHYYKKNIESDLNIPGARQGSAFWKDNQQFIYMFGGFGYDSSVTGYLNDFWKYNPSTDKWTWINNGYAKITAQYGKKGVESSTNFPGARKYANAWTDVNGNFWLFGGYGYDSINQGYLNDLWKYNPVSGNWTWINGDKFINSTGKDILDSLTNPSARSDAMTIYSDSDKNLWLYGGYGYDLDSKTGFLSDLWKYDAINNKWSLVKGLPLINLSAIYGTIKIPSDNAKPGGVKNGVLIENNNGNLYLFGGYGYDDSLRLGYLNILWKYNKSTNQWSFEKGFTKLNQFGSYSGVGDPMMPGCRTNTVGISDSSGNLIIFGGYGYGRFGSGYLNDIWKFEINTDRWYWLKGSDACNQQNIYGTLNQDTVTNNPSGRIGMGGWKDQNNLMIFGGYGYETPYLANYFKDLWKYNLTSLNWSWINTNGKHKNNGLGIYGKKNISDPLNHPGGRCDASGWYDSIHHKLLLYGGYGFSADNSGGLGDLWEYDILAKGWKWIGGSEKTNPGANYGTKGVASLTNSPGSRYGATAITSDNGNLFLIGGSPYSSANFLNDLWSYNVVTNKWMWVAGTNQANQMGSYGKLGISTTANQPGGRYHSGGWIVGDTMIISFGGYGMETTVIPTVMNDLWNYNLNNNKWTWFSGININNLFGIYNQLNTPDARNIPGARADHVTWFDVDNNLWLLGGYGFSEINFGYLNDLWKFNPLTRQWTWIRGEKLVNEFGNFGPSGEFSSTLSPGARRDAVTLTDKGNNIWLFGGYGYSKYNSGYLNDLWKFDPERKQWSFINGNLYANEGGKYNVKDSMRISTSLSCRTEMAGWVDTSGGLWFYGGFGMGYDSSFTLRSGKLNDIFKFDFGSYPVPEFIADTTEGCIPLEIHFTNLTEFGDKFSWDFGDGNKSENTNPVHIYNQGGVFTVTLGATNSAGTVYKIRKTYIIAHPRPAINFNVSPLKPIIGVPATFTNLTTDGRSYEWNFGDGDTSTMLHPTHTYNQLGFKTIILTVNSEFGCVVNKIFQNRIEVVPVPPIDPVAIFHTNSVIGCAPFNVKFLNNSLNSDKYVWDFGDQNSSGDFEPEHTYYLPGNYTVTLISANDSMSHTQTKTGYIVVSGGPTTDFSVDNLKPVVGDTVRFLNQTPEGVSFLWDFGDGYSSPLKDPSHKYSNLGLYDVTLVAYNWLGCSSKEIKSFFIEVIPPKPIVRFSTPATLGCSPFEVKFNNYTEYAGTYFWDFGNGKSSTEHSPVHSYNSPGKYSVSLIAYGQSGESSYSRSDYITVLVSPFLDINAEPRQTTVNTPIQFRNFSNGQIKSYLWDFGDSAFSSKTEPVYTYQKPGTYTITLNATSQSGCSISRKFPDFITVFPTSINENSGMIQKISVIPNPVNDKPVIMLEVKEPGKIDMELLNVLGQKIYEKNQVSLVSGSNKITMDDFPELKPGIYELRIKNKQISRSQKIFKP